MTSLMVLGTNSCCGKSFTTSALIRFLKKQGYSVAPFKAQNISSNTIRIGTLKELATSTFIQAQMAEIEPESMMNPVLIKPNNGEMQIFLDGMFYASDSYKEYYRYLPIIKKTVEKSFFDLRKKYDIIVIEGAGSPAEINCFEEDVSNCFMASKVDSAVIVGDISFGGVFAAVHGTLELMPKELRSKVTAFIVNKYLGEKSKLLDGISTIENLHDTKCIGIVPYIRHNAEDVNDMINRLDSIVSTEYDFSYLLKKNKI